MLRSCAGAGRGVLDGSDILRRGTDDSTGAAGVVHGDAHEGEEDAPSMTTYVLIPGAASDPWYWHLVAPELAARGHDVVTPDLPCDDDAAGFAEYADVVVDAIGDRPRPRDRGPVDGCVHGGRSCAPGCRSTCWCWWRP